MAKKQTPKVIKTNRDAETGRFVTEEYVKKNPKTTVTETNKKKK